MPRRRSSSSSGRLRLGDDPLDLGPDPVGASVGPRRGVGLDAGGVQGYESDPDESYFSGQAQHLVEQVRELLLVVSREAGDGGVVGGLVGGDEAEGDVLHAPPLDQARGSRSGGVGVDEQGHHHLRVVGRSTPPIDSAPGVERRQVEGLHDRDDVPREVVLWQPVVQARRHQERLVPVAGNEVVGHGSSERGELRWCDSLEAPAAKPAHPGFSRHALRCESGVFVPHTPWDRSPGR